MAVHRQRHINRRRHGVGRIHRLGETGGIGDNLSDGGGMKIRIYSGEQRKKPATGDIRITKKHGMQIRVPSMIHNHRGEPIGYDCTGGRQNYEWRKPAQLMGTRWEYLVRKLEAAS